MRKNWLIYKLFILLIFTSACRTPVQQDQGRTEDPYKKPLLETNQYIRERHHEQIRAFVDRVGWTMNETSSGLWYMIEKEGNGPTIQEGDFLSYAYETRLLNGNICYAADTISPKKIVVGKGNIEAGLEEGLLKLKNNCKATFIIPPYLAHGNFGDMDKIPGSSILLIRVSILNVKR